MFLATVAPLLLAHGVGQVCNALVEHGRALLLGQHSVLVVLLGRLGLVVATVRRRGKQQDMSVTSPTFRNSSRYSTLTLSTLFATRAASNNAVFSVAKCSNVL